MYQSYRLFSAMPPIMLVAATAAFIALLMLLNFPETIMRHVIASMSSQITQQAHVKTNPVLTAFTDEIIDKNTLESASDGLLQPVGLLGSFQIGDRLSVQHQSGGPRSLIVTNVRRIEPGPDIPDRDRSRNWTMVTTADSLYPEGPKYRFIVEEGEPLPFGLKQNNARAL